MRLSLALYVSPLPAGSDVAVAAALRDERAEDLLVEAMAVFGEQLELWGI
jgi:hypothetical protein